ncbi:MAG TPA: DUF1634 domain-containing protein [Bryobacteraceae bacterium]|nr:DUF1634 domain-containing protein [Bryobacteraceae bacterium]
MQRNEEHLDLTIGVLLRTGVITAASVVFAGGVWYLVRSGMLAPNYRAFQGEPEGLRSVGGVLRGVAGLHPRSIIQLGLLLLVATPIARVGLTVVAFALRRDWIYLALTIAVFTVLVWSLSGLGYSPH